MSGSFSPAADAWTAMTAGSAGALGTGAYTIAALVRPAGNDDGFVSLYAGATEVRSLLGVAGHLYGKDDFSDGFGSMASGNWYVCAQSKPAGSATYRHHLWAYASDGSGTMSHGVSTNSGSHGDGSAVTESRIGFSILRGNGLIAAVGLWASEVSDAQLDTLKSGSLSAWAALSPAELISLENWNGSAGCTAVVGTSTQSSITGTVSAGSNPPGFNFSLGSTELVPGVLAPSLSGPALTPSASGSILTATTSGPTLTAN